MLFLKGVYKKDCVLIDDIFEENLMANINDCSITATENELVNISKTDHLVSCNKLIELNTKQNHYEKLPHFKGLDTWPCKTNLLCWSCSLSFDSIPIFIPKAIEPIIKNRESNNYSIDNKGVFCSFGCAYYFIQNKTCNLIERTENINKLRFLYKLFYNENMPDYNNFPSPYNMVQYGGDWTIKKFKKTITKFH